MRWLPTRHLQWRLYRLRPRLVRRGSVLALLAVVGPGVLGGLSDDDPAGITTYSILGAKYGYELLWVLTLSTAALIIFHELAVRMGIVTGKGLLAVVRERYGHRAATIAVGLDLLVGASRCLSVPVAAIAVSLLVLRASFYRVEHVLCLRWRRFSWPTSPRGCSPTRTGVPRRAATLFGLGFVGAALLAAAIVPLSTSYSASEAFEAPADVNDSFRQAPHAEIRSSAHSVIVASSEPSDALSLVRASCRVL